MLKTPTNGIFSPTLNNVQNGDTLVYDSYTNNWVNVPSSGGGSLVINTVDGVMDRTWQEIFNALTAGVYCVVLYGNEDQAGQEIIQEAYFYDDDDYRIYTIGNSDTYYGATSASGYPQQRMS